MSAYEYYVVNLHNGLYIEPMMSCLGEALDYCVNELGMTGQEALDAFIRSGMAQEFERQNPVYVLGKSGAELTDDFVGIRADAYRALPEGGDSKDCACDGEKTSMRDPWASWIGEMIAFYQATSGCSYERICTALPYQRLTELAIVYASEATPESFADILHERVSEAPYHSRLQARRLTAGFSQAQLAERAGLSLRAVQQYEQGAKNINHAQAAAIYRLALVLDCSIEDLLEPPVI